MGFPNEAAYRDAADAAGLAGHMHFTGRVPYADAPEMLRVLDIAVAPKRSESEGNGKVLNYMAAGLPVVAYDGPVARELLGDAGLRVPVGSVEGLAEGLLRYLADADLRTHHGRGPPPARRTYVRLGPPDPARNPGLRVAAQSELTRAAPILARLSGSGDHDRL